MTPEGPSHRAARTHEDSPHVYIGARPTMTYVFQVVAQLNSGAGPVLVKARGATISKAVDVVEVIRRRLLPGDVAVGAIEIATERLTNRDGRGTNVSSITIPLTRTSPPPPVPPNPPVLETKPGPT